MSRELLLTGILTREGWPRVTEHPFDKGGLTKGGVTIRSFNGWRVANGERPLTPDEFIGIDEPTARAFFSDAFLRPFEFLADAPCFELLVDWAVNAGVDDPTMALQTELSRRRLYHGAIDGIPGPVTRSAWLRVAGATAAVAEISAALLRARADFHLDRGFDAQVREFLATHPSTQLHSLRGWIRRTLGFSLSVGG